MTNHYCCSWCEKEFSSAPDTTGASTATCPVCGMAAYPRSDGDHDPTDHSHSLARTREANSVE